MFASVPVAMNTGATMYICMRIPRCPQMDDVLQPARAEHLHGIVGALADPKTKTLETKYYPLNDEAVKRKSSGLRGT